MSYQYQQITTNWLAYNRFTKLVLRMPKDYIECVTDGRSYRAHLMYGETRYISAAGMDGMVITPFPSSAANPLFTLFGTLKIPAGTILRIRDGLQNNNPYSPEIMMSCNILGVIYAYGDVINRNGGNWDYILGRTTDNWEEDLQLATTFLISESELKHIMAKVK